jgi:hypothetical protein
VLFRSPDELRTRGPAGKAPALWGPWAPVGALVDALAEGSPLRIRVAAGAPGDLLPILVRGWVPFCDDPVLVAFLDLVLHGREHLGPGGLGGLLGLTPFGRRLWLYHRLREHLPQASQRFWDAREGWIRGGLIGAQAEAAGRWEQQLGRHGARISRLPPIVGGVALRALWSRAVGGRSSARSLAIAIGPGLLANLQGPGVRADLEESRLAQVPLPEARARRLDPEVWDLCWHGRSGPGTQRARVHAGWTAAGEVPRVPESWRPRPGLAALLRTPLVGAPWVYEDPRLSERAAW